MKYLLLLLALPGCMVAAADTPSADDERLEAALDAARGVTVPVEATQPILVERWRDVAVDPPEPPDDAVVPHLPPVIEVTLAPFHCPPCESFNAANERGDLADFTVKFIEPRDGIRAYPAIEFYQDGKRKVIYGWDDSWADWLREQHGLEPVAKETTGYPVRGSWWTLNGGYPSDDVIRRHLIETHGYTSEQIAGLSYDELHSLHSDDHEGRAQIQRPTRYQYTYQYCPTCPQ